MAGFFSRLKSIFSGHSAIDEDFYEELEETLIMGDMGITATEEVMEELRRQVKERHVKETEDCRELLKESIKEQMQVPEDAYDFENQQSVIMVIGVNGVGKTTSVGKLAAIYKKQGKRVLIAAADTFRAAAGEQLDEWAKRAGVEIISGAQGADPSSVIFDAVSAAKARNVDILLCDTAGRLHNKKNLMEELAKIYRVIDRELPYSDREVLLVLDATTGQNAVNQAREFMNAAEITGIVLTKLDGTARGGVVLSIMDDLKIPVKFVGVGEQVDDLQPFDAEAFAQGLFEEVSREEDGLQES